LRGPIERAKVIQSVGKINLEASMGRDDKDDATGNFIGVGKAALIGAQKATIAEQLIRSKRHDGSSRKVERTADVLEVMGIFGRR
jgi:hypothetical protein